MPEHKNPPRSRSNNGRWRDSNRIVAFVSSFFEPDHRELEKQQTDALYERVYQLHGKQDDIIQLGLSFFRPIENRIPEKLYDQILDIFVQIFLLEDAVVEMPEYRQSFTMREMVEFRDALRRKERYHQNADRINKLIGQGMLAIFEPVLENIPSLETPSPFTIPLAYTFPNPKQSVQNIYGELMRQEYRETVFVELSRTLFGNLMRISDITDPDKSTKTPLMPTRNKAPLHEIIEDYLIGTPLYDLYTIPVPLKFHEERFSHMHVLGGCVRGDTPIYDPTDHTCSTVAERHKKSRTFHVFALTKNGNVVIARACPPKKFKRQPMYRLSNGLHSIHVTGAHRVYDGSSYVTVSHLQKSGAFRLPTIEVSDLLMWKQGALCSKKTDEGSQYGCLPLSHLYGQQLQSALGSGPVFFPSQHGAHESCCVCLCKDGLEHKAKYNRSYLRCAHLSMQGFYRHGCNNFSGGWEHCLVSDISEPLGRLHPCAAVFHFETSQFCTAPTTFRFSPYSILLPSGNFTTWKAELDGDGVYYDFFVPDYNNYWACGLFHHNSGSGKTQLLQQLIMHDLQSDCGMVIVDSQGDLIDRIVRLDHPARERFILISPKDVHHPPAINIFDIQRERMGNYTQQEREQVTAGAIETFDYLFTGLLGADLTAKQGIFFRYIARLLLSLPETMGRPATILDIIKLMDDPKEYEPAINLLPDIQRDFFVRDFIGQGKKRSTFDQTRDQIRYRLQGIIENPTLARLFTAPRTKIDLFTELNNGSIILVDTAQDFLKGASAHFGRIFIALTLQAILERAAILEHERKPAFLYVDEAADYFDSNIDNLLTEARKYKLGCIFAHQYLDQCTPSLKSSFASNTAIKMAAGVSNQDARFMASDMRTTPDFILEQPRLHFASYIRGVTPSAVSVPVDVGLMERVPRLTQKQYRDFIQENRKRVALPLPLPYPTEEPSKNEESAPQEPVGESREDPTNRADTEW